MNTWILYLLAMIAGFIFLRLRGILGKKQVLKEKYHLRNEKEFHENNHVKPKPD